MIRPLRKLLTSSLVPVAVGTAYYCRYLHPFHPVVRHETIRVSNKHQWLADLSIVFVTDTHVGPHIRAEDLDPVVNALLRLQPDIMLFGGDYICESPRFWREASPALKRMADTAKFGAFGIPGNHDLANTRHALESGLAEANIHLLTNTSVRIDVPTGSLWIAGLDDILLGKSTGGAETAFTDVPQDAPAIALIHEPDACERLIPYRPLVTLSGHTHGGQIRLPGLGGLGAPKMGKRWQTGHFDIQGMPLIVSNGIGMYRPPVRFNCPPEIISLSFEP